MYISDTLHIPFHHMYISCRQSFEIVPQPTFRNTSPVLHVDHNLGLESWCIKDLYSFVHEQLLLSTGWNHHWSMLLLKRQWIPSELSLQLMWPSSFASFLFRNWMSKKLPRRSFTFKFECENLLELEKKISVEW